MKIKPVTLAIVLWLSGLAGVACASFGELTPKAQRAVDTFECRVEALKPYIDPVLDAEELVRDIAMGKANPETALYVVGASRAEFEAAVAAWNACSQPSERAEELPTNVVPARLVAPPPAYGNKVL